jgi:hypothetical protein
VGKATSWWFGVQIPTAPLLPLLLILSEDNEVVILGFEALLPVSYESKFKKIKKIRFLHLYAPIHKFFHLVYAKYYIITHSNKFFIVTPNC